MAADYDGVAASQILNKSFLRYRQQQFDAEVDEKLKREGEKILDKYDPELNQSGKFNTHSIFWMIASMATIYLTDFFLALRYDQRIDRFWLYIGAALIGINALIGMFFIIFYHLIRKDPDYEKQWPFAVPIATVAFVIGMTCCCVGLWPVWGILTPVIIFVIFMGTIFFLSILPF